MVSNWNWVLPSTLVNIDACFGCSFSCCWCYCFDRLLVCERKWKQTNNSKKGFCAPKVLSSSPNNSMCDWRLKFLFFSSSPLLLHNTRAFVCSATRLATLIEIRSVSKVATKVRRRRRRDYAVSRSQFQCAEKSSSLFALSSAFLYGLI